MRQIQLTWKNAVWPPEIGAAVANDLIEALHESRRPTPDDMTIVDELVDEAMIERATVVLDTALIVGTLEGQTKESTKTVTERMLVAALGDNHET